MKKRKGFFTIILAVMMLIFSTLATVFINEMSENLLKTSVKLDEGKEDRYNKIVMKSIENSIGYLGTISGNDSYTSTYTLTIPFSQAHRTASTTIYFTVKTENLDTEEETQGFIEVNITQSTQTTSSIENYGTIISYKK